MAKVGVWANEDSKEGCVERAAGAAQSCPVASRPVSSPRVTLDEARAKASVQMADDTMSARDIMRMREVVSVLAEVYMMPDHYTLIVNGDTVELAMIKDVLEHLTPEMALYVLERMDRLTVRYSRKSLLRAMLYNEVFEHEGHVQQDVEDDTPLGYIRVEGLR